MQEFEIKLQVPPAQRAALDAALGRGRAGRRMRLRATYHDTPGRHLAAAGIALRVRQEGRRRVQTLKMAGADALTRFEHNVALQPRDVIDVQRHAGTPGGERLLQVLAAAAQPLQETYRTDILRRTRVSSAGRQRVEIVLDVGEIIAGQRRLPVCELEIELLEGAPQAVLDVARRWALRYGLWIDVRSKAERGDRLSRGEAAAAVTAVKAGAVELPPAATVEQAWQAVARASLLHLLPNASELACPQCAGEDRSEHLHQVRVGLRRLRAAVRFFRGLGDGLDVQPLGEEAAALFARFGAARDGDVAAALLKPVWAEAGLPPATLQTPGTIAPAEVLRSGEAQALWLELLGWAYREPGGGVPLKPAAAKRLKRWHREVVSAIEGFDAMDDTGRHTLRKRVKRLRYAVDFAGSLFPRRQVKRYLKALAQAQDAFGEFNDACMARELLHGRDDAASLYARGWLAARRDALLPRCKEALVALADAPEFWR